MIRWMESCLIIQLTTSGGAKVPLSIMFGSLVSTMVQIEYNYLER